MQDEEREGAKWQRMNSSGYFFLFLLAPRPGGSPSETFGGAWGVGKLVVVAADVTYYAGRGQPLQGGFFKKEGSSLNCVKRYPDTSLAG